MDTDLNIEETVTGAPIQTPFGVEPGQTTTSTIVESITPADATALITLFPGLAGSGSGVNLATVTAAQLAAGVSLGVLSAALTLALTPKS